MRARAGEVSLHTCGARERRRTGTGVRGNVVGNVVIYAVVFLYLWAAMWTPGAKSSTSTWKRRDYEAQVTRLPGEPHARRRANVTRSVARRAWRPPS